MDPERRFSFSRGQGENPVSPNAKDDPNVATATGSEGIETDEPSSEAVKPKTKPDPNLPTKA